MPSAPEPQDALIGLWQSMTLLGVGLVAAKEWLELVERESRYGSWIFAYA